MSKITNHTKSMQIVKLEDGSAIFMKSGQTTTTSKKIAFVPTGVRVEESPTKRPKTTKTQTESNDDQILEEKS